MNKAVFTNGGMKAGRRRVLILTAGFGEGHNAAARGVAEAVEAECGAGAARVADVFAMVRPRANERARKFYLWLINAMPWLWGWVYRLMDGTRVTGWFLRGWLMRREKRMLAELLVEEKGCVVVATYPVYAFLLEGLLRERRVVELPVFFNVVTDSISIHSLWWRAGAVCAGWFVANEDSAAVMSGAGVGMERVFVSGFPVRGAFWKSERVELPVLEEGVRKRVLVVVNSGARRAVELANLLFEERDWEVTVAVGRNEELRARIEGMARGRSGVRVLGWVEDLPGLLMSHHVVVSKAGGATVQEALAAGCPFVACQSVPGQEEGNVELLQRHGAGVLAERPREVLRVLKGAFANEGEGWREWREGAELLSRPFAAREIARMVLRGRAEEKVEEAPVMREKFCGEYI